MTKNKHSFKKPLDTRPESYNAQSERHESASN